MKQEMKGLLLEDLWAPVTSMMGFLELGAEQAAQAFATWQRGLMTPRGITVPRGPAASIPAASTAPPRAINGSDGKRIR